MQPFHCLVSRTLRDERPPEQLDHSETAAAQRNQAKNPEADLTVRRNGMHRNFPGAPFANSVKRTRSELGLVGLIDEGL